MVIPEPSDNRSLNVVKLFDEECPYYLSIGMSYADYWDGDALMPKYYRNAFALRKKHENYLAWLQGAYVYEAISDLAPVLKAFAKGSPKPYRNDVIPVTEEEQREYKERKEREQYERNIAYMRSKAEEHNRELRKKEAEAHGSINGRSQL